MDLAGLIRDALRRPHGGGVNIASAVNVDNAGSTTSVSSDGHVTVITRDGETQVIRHGEEEEARG